MASARSLAVVERKSTAFDTDQPVSAYYISHLPPDNGSARKLCKLIRGHWSGCESRNHWVRDAIFGEDKTRSRNYNLNANLAILRCCLISLKALLVPDGTSWPALQERCQHQSSIPYQMIVNQSFK